MAQTKNQEVPIFEGQARRTVLPGVRGRSKVKLTTKDGHVIPKGSNIIIQPLGEGTYQVTTFKKDSAASHLPEGQRNIIREASYQVDVNINEQDAFRFDEQYQFSNRPLFPNDDSPSFDDITQGQIPDCFLLAVLHSTMNAKNGKEYLRSIMKENDDGTVTVRLFNPKTLRPEYVTVPNAILVDNKGKPLNSHQALWVHVLENAYVSMLTKGGSELGSEVDASFTSIFNEKKGSVDFYKRMLAKMSATAEKSEHKETNSMSLYSP
jgi:hypothetical protein